MWFSFILTFHHFIILIHFLLNITIYSDYVIQYNNIIGGNVNNPSSIVGDKNGSWNKPFCHQTRYHANFFFYSFSYFFSFIDLPANPRRFKSIASNASCRLRDRNISLERRYLLRVCPEVSLNRKMLFHRRIAFPANSANYSNRRLFLSDWSHHDKTSHRKTFAVFRNSTRIALRSVLSTFAHFVALLFCLRNKNINGP